MLILVQAPRFGCRLWNDLLLCVDSPREWYLEERVQRFISILQPQATLYCFTNDSTEIGVISLPSGAGQLIGGVILPALVHKIKRIRGQFVTAMLIQTIFCALYAVALTGQRERS